MAVLHLSDLEIVWEEEMEIEVVSYQNGMNKKVEGVSLSSINEGSTRLQIQIGRKPTLFARHRLKGPESIFHINGSTLTL